MPPYRCPAVTGPACANVPPVSRGGALYCSLATAVGPEQQAGAHSRPQPGGQLRGQPSSVRAEALHPVPKRFKGLVLVYNCGMDAPRTITCASFWDVMVLRHMLAEQGVRVHSPDPGVVALSMVVSGPLDVIKAAAAELTGQYRRSGPVIIEGEDDDEAADDAAYLFADLDSGDA